MTKLTKIIRRYTSIASAIDMLRRRQLTLLDPATWDDRNDRYFMQLYKEGRKVGGVYAACAATCSETYHHWRVFTNAADGACIEIKRPELEAALETVPKVRFGKVSYLNLEQVEGLDTGDLYNLPFFKRVAFEPEDEYRIILETTEVQRPAIGLEFPLEWISRIQLNPWLPQPVADSLVATLREIKDCEKLSVVRSHLIDSGRWKKSGDMVAGKKPHRSLAVRRFRKLPPSK